MRVLIFSTTFIWKISRSKKKLTRCKHKYILVFIQCTRSSCQILINIECSQQIFEKYSNIKFHKNSFSGSRVAPCGRTDMTLIGVFFLAILRKRPETERKRSSGTDAVKIEWNIDVELLYIKINIY